MNRKLIILIVAIVIILCAVGFIFLNSNENTTSNDNSNKDESIEEDGTNTGDSNTSDSNTAIIYFSATGTTEEVALYIEEAVGGDLIEIIPEEEYTSADLNYSNDDCRANREQNDSSSRPGIANSINTDSYDVIYLGYPIWWGDAPKIILTFLDSHDLSGKTVIPFCTSGGSGIDVSVDYFKENYENINWLDGRRLSSSKDEVIAWVNSLDYLED